MENVIREGLGAGPAPLRVVVSCRCLDRRLRGDLDIQMPGGGGFGLLEQLHDPPAIVFVTAHDEYAIRAFEVNAVDYLLKPVEPHRLALAVARLQCEKGVRTEWHCRLLA